MSQARASSFISSWDNLSAFKEALFAASDRIKSEVGSCSLSDHEQVFWAMMAARGVRNSAPRPIIRAVRALPSLKKFFPQIISHNGAEHRIHTGHAELVAGGFEDVKYGELCGFVRSLSDDVAATRDEAEAMSEMNDDARACDKKKAHRQTCRHKWRPVRRRIAIDRVSDDAESAPTAIESAECLRAHWSPIFAEKSTCSDSMERLRPFVASAADFPLRMPSVEEIAEILRHTRNSAPGPDGVPFAAYKATVDICAGLFSECLGDALAGDDLPDEMKESLLIFIPKCDDFGDHTMKPGEVRPLSLGNTDAKVIASALNFGMSNIAQQIVHESQTGFLLGRSMSENILRVEAEALRHTVTPNVRTSALVFYDFAAAFPSISHYRIVFVLEAMNIDKQAIHLIKAMYSGCLSHICIARSRYGTIDIKSRIRQGCPLSGTLFAILLDPVIRMMHATAPELHGELSIGAYADDIAHVMSDHIRDLPRMLEVFKLARKASALTLKFSKCVVVPLNIFEPLEEHEARLHLAVPEIVSATVAFHARYLGATIGPKSHLCRWRRPAAAMVARSRWICEQSALP